MEQQQVNIPGIVHLMNAKTATACQRMPDCYNPPTTSLLTFCITLLVLHCCLPFQAVAAPAA